MSFASIAFSRAVTRKKFTNSSFQSMDCIHSSQKAAYILILSEL